VVFFVFHFIPAEWYFCILLYILQQLQVGEKDVDWGHPVNLRLNPHKDYHFPKMYVFSEHLQKLTLVLR
jgi:hypothetical protein